MDRYVVAADKNNAYSLVKILFMQKKTIVYDAREKSLQCIRTFFAVADEEYHPPVIKGGDLVKMRTAVPAVSHQSYQSHVVPRGWYVAFQAPAMQTGIRRRRRVDVRAQAVASMPASNIRSSF